MESRSRQEQIVAIIAVAEACGSTMSIDEGRRELALTRFDELEALMADADDFDPSDVDARHRSKRAKIWHAAAMDAVHTQWNDMALDAAEHAILIMEGNL